MYRIIANKFRRIRLVVLQVIAGSRRLLDPADKPMGISCHSREGGNPFMDGFPPSRE
jgi:hypothetical protein